MVQPLKRYPDDSINVNAGPIRSYKESFKDMLQDLLDTAKEHNLDTLSAIEIGYPYQLMIVKNSSDEYDIYTNPRIITQNEPFKSNEKSPYLHNIEIPIARYKKLSVIYDDTNGNMQTKKVEEPEYAANFQRSLDYLFNTSIIDRLMPNQREQVIKALANRGHKVSLADELCPTNSKKEYFVSVADKLLFFMFISLLLPLFGISKETLNSWFTYDKFAFLAVIVLMIGFFIYAYFEGKKFKQCTSCQIGNNIGVLIKRVVVGTILAIGAYLILG